MKMNRAEIIDRLKLDHRAGQGLADAVWLSLAEALAAKPSRGVSYFRPSQEQNLRLAVRR